MTAADNAFIPKTHISLNVKNLEHSVAFYEGFFGVPAHKRRPGYANFDIANPPLKLALQEAPVTAGVGTLSHLGIQVATPAEVDAARERLIASGLASFDEGDTVCCYALQNKIWAHDPDGNGWEVYVLLDEMDDEDDDHFAPGGLAGDSACCSGVPASATIALTAVESASRPTSGRTCCG
jgi:catechol 2,3-dioxygenase-like lactoylglutathione lyase family enzyme